MPLYHTPSPPNSDAEHLATEARKRLTELSDTMFWAYSQLQNYLTNNTQGVKAEEIKKALGSDRKSFESAMRAMKRFLVIINPEFKERIIALTPKQTSKPAP